MEPEKSDLISMNREELRRDFLQVIFAMKVDHVIAFQDVFTLQELEEP